MPRTPHGFSLVKLSAAAALFAAALGLTVHAQPPDSKKPADPKAAPAPKESPLLKLSDGTFLWSNS